MDRDTDQSVKDCKDQNVGLIPWRETLVRCRFHISHFGFGNCAEDTTRPKSENARMVAKIEISRKQIQAFLYLGKGRENNVLG